MKLRTQIKEIDFCDVVLKAMPVLQEKVPNDGSAISKIITVVTQLPHEVIRTMLDAVSQEDKCEIVALLVRENKEKLRQALSQLLKQNEIDVSLDEIDISNDMVIGVGISNLDYAALAAKYLPFVRDGLIIGENPATEILHAMLKLPGMLLYGALAKIPQNKKDETVAYLINKNKDRIIAKLEDMLANQDIHIRLDDLKVEV